MAEQHLCQLETDRPGAAVHLVAQSSVRHHLTALQAIEQTVNLSVRRERRKTRELIQTLEERIEHLEEVIRRHCLH